MAGKLLCLVLAALALLFQAHNCDINNCHDCLQATKFGAYSCYWCKIDNGCHSIHSVSSSCAEASASSCVTLSPLEHCHPARECPEAGAHRSKHQTCEKSAAGGPVQDKALSVGTHMKAPGKKFSERITDANNVAKHHLNSTKSIYNQRMIKAREKVARMGIKEQHDAEVALQELISMSEAVYDLEKFEHIYHKPPDGWHIDACWRDLKWQHNVGPMMAVYINMNTMMAVLAIKGSEFGRLEDVDIDAANIVGGFPPVGPLISGARIVKDYQDRGFTVLVTGHSMGGYLAEIIATTIGLAGAGFCAPGPGIHNGYKGGIGSGFRNVNFLHDLFGNYGQYGNYKHAQWPLYLEDYGLWFVHDGRLMWQSMMARGSNWTNQNALCMADWDDYRGYYSKVEGLRNRPEDIPVVLSQELRSPPLCLFEGKVLATVAACMLLSAVVMIARSWRVSGSGSGADTGILQTWLLHD